MLRLKKDTLRRLCGTPVRLIFGQRTMTVSGEGNVPLEFYPSESPSLLLGVKRSAAYERVQWQQLVKPGDVILDVGAHIGLTVQRFLSLLNGKCQVIAVEPVLRNFELLKKNTSNFPANSVSLFNIALGDRDGFAMFSQNKSFGAISQLTELRSNDETGHWKDEEQQETPIHQLDSLIDLHHLPDPTFLKLDVEGAAGLLLAGAKRTLNRSKPIVYCQYHSSQERREVADAVRNAGYRGMRFNEQKMTWTDPLKHPAYFVHPDSPMSNCIL